MNNILLVDDHQVIREGVKTVLKDMFSAWAIHEASDEKSAINQLKARPYKLIITDVKMPDSQPFGLTEYITAQYPEARLLIFSMNDEHLYAKKFLQMGAMGFVSKNSDLADLRKAIDRVLKGRRYISEHLGGHLIDMLKEDQSGSSPFEKLSRRELEIVALMVEGKAAQEIAGILSIAQSTVGSFKARIFEKLGVKNLAELIEAAKINGL